MENSRLRAIILNLQDRLSNDDRRRLHFNLGNKVPRRVRDDSTLAGSLALMDTLFDQDRINDDDFTFLINVLEEIHCIDAANLLREHLNQNEAHEGNRSMQNLSLIMPSTWDRFLQDNDEEDTIAVESDLTTQQNTHRYSNRTVTNGNINQDPIPIVIHNTTTSSPKEKRKSPLRKSSFLCVLLSVVICTVLISFCTWNYIEVRRMKQTYTGALEQLKMNYTQIGHLAKQLEHILTIMESKQPKQQTKTGITVAEGHGEGNELNQLFWSHGIFIDQNETMYIADLGNDRIVQWKSDSTTGDIIAGGSCSENQADKLPKSSPSKLKGMVFKGDSVK